MHIVRPNDSTKIVVAAAEVPLQPQTEIFVNQGDCCVVTHQGQVVGTVGPGHWWLQQYPFCGPLLADPAPSKGFLFVLTHRAPPLKLGGRLPDGGRFIAQATVVVRDPATVVRNVVGQSDPDVEAWLTAILGRAVSGAYDPTKEPDELVRALPELVSQSVGPELAQSGIAFEQLSEIKLMPPRPEQGSAGVMGVAQDGASERTPDGSAQKAASSSDRVELIGAIAGCVETPSSDPNAKKLEQFGLFVAADPLAIRHYSGGQLGWRWLARGAGELVDEIGGWPLAPNGDTSDYFATGEQAHAYYAALRQHAFASVPSLQAQDTRQGMGLNAPHAYSETLWNEGREVFYLIYDHMEDMVALGNETDCIGIFPAGPPDPQQPALPIITYKTRSDRLYLAARRGASGGAEHVLIVLSDAQAPRPTIPEGLPRAEWMSKYEHAALRFNGDILVVQWGRFSGAEVLGAEHGNDPIATLKAKLGNQLAVALTPEHEASQRLGSVPAAYAVRMEPGSYNLNYYELHTKQHGSFLFCAVSRDGAESFMPEAVGNAGGVILAGLSIEQYAMLSVERDDLVMQLGPQAIYSPQMEALCTKYGVAYNRDGTAGRVYEWEHYLTNDPAFSAQWSVQLGIARMRLQGQEPNEQQIAAIAQQQSVVQNALEQNAQQLDAIRDAAIQVIRSAASRTPEDVTGMVQQWYPQLGVETVLHKTLRILREPDEFGRFDNAGACVEPLARAHFRSMSPEDQRFEGSEDKYFKGEREVIYSAYDIEVPGLLSKLFG